MQKIVKPQIFVDKKRMIQNLQKMISKARNNKVNLRPHVKTHQSLEIAAILRNYGIRKIAVSSLDMAKYFVQGGWKDIIVCVPFNILQIDELNCLVERYSDCTIQVVCENIITLRSVAKRAVKPIKIWIEIDVGYNRTGILSDHLVEIGNLVEFCKQEANLNFEGILTHSGHSYHAPTKKKINSIHEHETEEMRKIKYYLKTKIGINAKVSIGDTPTCSIIDEFDPTIITEIRPGNFIFYDLKQHFVGSCNLEDIAVAIACPIIAKYPEREEIIIYGGSIHFSYYHGKNSKLHEKNDDIFGLVCKFENESWVPYGYDVYLNALSQEHGRIHAPLDIINSLNLGDILFILPFHACTSANLYSHLLTLEGEKWETFRYNPLEEDGK